MTTPRAMLVDDNAFIRKMLALFMANLDFTFEEFADPARAVDTFAHAPDAYDLVVTDIFMEGMTGFELAERIRRVRRAMPIVLMSGVPYRSDGELIEPGMIFLSKPFTQDALAGAIDVVLGPRHPHANRGPRQQHVRRSNAGWYRLHNK